MSIRRFAFGCAFAATLACAPPGDTNTAVFAQDSNTVRPAPCSEDQPVRAFLLGGMPSHYLPQAWFALKQIESIVEAGIYKDLTVVDVAPLDKGNVESSYSVLSDLERRTLVGLANEELTRSAFTLQSALLWLRIPRHRNTPRRPRISRRPVAFPMPMFMSLPRVGSGFSTTKPMPLLMNDSLGETRRQKEHFTRNFRAPSRWREANFFPISKPSCVTRPWRMSLRVCSTRLQNRKPTFDWW